MSVSSIMKNRFVLMDCFLHHWLPSSSKSLSHLFTRIIYAAHTGFNWDATNTQVRFRQQERHV